MTGRESAETTIRIAVSDRRSQQRVGFSRRGAAAAATSSSRRYPDRQIRAAKSVYTYINKTQRRRPWLPSPPRWVDTLRAATRRPLPPSLPRPRAPPLSLRLAFLVPPLSFAPTALFPFNPFHPSSHIPIFTHHPRPASSHPFCLLPLRVVLRFHFLLLLLRPSPLCSTSLPPPPPPPPPPPLLPSVASSIGVPVD